ncbi:hypothetical protein M758_3G247200 [Ceratodon purpureus]|nr:hypothetical protein M758_3G247200 [Ceratodon purpureus]
MWFTSFCHSKITHLVCNTEVVSVPSLAQSTSSARSVWLISKRQKSPCYLHSIDFLCLVELPSLRCHLLLQLYNPCLEMARMFHQISMFVLAIHASEVPP